MKILFLCTGNSARSIIAENVIRLVDTQKKFESYSAGADPKSQVNPLTIQILKDLYGMDASDAKPKSWDVFKDEGVDFDFVITVCDDAQESCPVWPGQPIIAHWGSVDPAAVEGTDEEKYAAFKKVAIEIRRRLELFTSLPFDKLDRLRLEEATRNVARDTAEATS